MNICKMWSRGVFTFVIFLSLSIGVSKAINHSINTASEIVTTPVVQKRQLLSKSDKVIQLSSKLNFRERMIPKFTSRKLAQLHEEKFNDEIETRKIHGLALTGFILGAVSIFFAGIPLGILAIIFSAVAHGKIKKYPKKYRGKGFVIAGLVLGAVGILGALIVVSMM